jgi:sugar lactone lactonase YvrE
MVVYVGDSGNCRVQMFDGSGNYIKQFGTCGTGNGQFNIPSGIAIDASGNVWVSDYGNQTVQQFSSTGTWLQTIGDGTWGCGNNQFNEAAGVAIDGSGNILVADKDNNRIQKFDKNGTYISSIGAGYNGVSGAPCSSGSGNGQMLFVQGVAVDKSGNIWVQDGGNGRLQEFSSNGVWLQTVNTGIWGTAINFDSGGNLWMAWWGYAIEKLTGNAVDTGFHLDQADPGCCEGTANGLNYGVMAITFDSNGNIWITDPFNARVQEFNSSGNWIKSIGGPPPYTCETSPSGSSPACPAGSANGQFNFNGNGWSGIAISGR